MRKLADVIENEINQVYQDIENTLRAHCAKEPQPRIEIAETQSDGVGSDLFARFTADIIKEDVVFTR